jgi:chromate transporter
VVGLLAATLAGPVWGGAIHSAADLALASAAWVLLVVARWSPWRVVLLAALAGWAIAGT